MERQEFRLSNGLPVILQDYAGLVASTYWWNQVGSVDEKPNEYGFAHFLEHMLFKDAAAKETGKPSSGKMARVIESLGGDINAFTSFEQTVYHVTSAEAHWEAVIDEFGQMASRKKFLNEDFRREREVILEELKKNNDSPGRQMYETLFRLVFEGHPYGRPVIGFEKILKAANVKMLEKFYQQNYVPKKMGLILVGPLENASRRERILKILEKRFGGHNLTSPERSTTSQRSDLQPLKGKLVVQPFDVQTPSIAFAFRTPGIHHADVPALDVLAGILGMGESSRLYRGLFYEKSLVTEVSASLYVPRDIGMFYLQAETDKMTNLEAVSEMMFQEVRRLTDEGPQAEEIARVRANIESEKLYSTQTSDGFAGRIGFLRFTVEDFGFDHEYAERLAKITPTHLQEIARKYLVASNVAGVLMVPKAEKSYSAKKVWENAQQNLPSGKQPKTPLRVEKPKPFVISQRPSGLRTIFCRRPQSHTFSIHASTLGGSRLEADMDWGVSQLLAQTWSKGTRKMSGKEISALVEGKAASLDGFSGRNSIGLEMTGLARDWKALSTLFVDVLCHPTFPDEELEHSRRVTLDQIRTIEDHSAHLCSQIFMETLFTVHPYGRLPAGTVDSVSRLTADRLRKYHSGWFQRKNLVLSLSGNVEPEAWAEFLSEIDEQLQSAGDPGPALPNSLPPEPLKMDRWSRRELGREQIHILVGGFGTRVVSADKTAVRLLQNILSGQSGRLFIELREKKSLAYTVTSTGFEGLDPGYIATYIGCAREKEQAAIEGIRSVLKGVAAKGVAESEIARAKNFYLGRRAMDMQTDSSLAANFGLEFLYGIGPRTEEEVTREVKAVNRSAIQKACEKYLVGPSMVTTVVG